MKKLQLTILLLLIAYGSIGAVTFVSGLPLIAAYFKISTSVANYTITSYLFGYAFGQLIYRPLTNRFGVRISLLTGVIISLLGTVAAIASYYLNCFSILVIARCVMALGCACGLKMTFTLTSKLYTHHEAARVMGLLTIAFAITPSIGIYLGSIAITMLNWTGGFYVMLFYSAVILLLINKLPGQLDNNCYQEMSFQTIVLGYFYQLRRLQTVLGGVMIGIGTSFVYIFAAVSPFIIMEHLHLSAAAFGYYSFIPSIGIVVGSILANHSGKILSPEKCLLIGIIMSLLGCMIMTIGYVILPNNALGLFMPMIVIYIGLSFIFGNAAAIAMKDATDKSNASAVMSFINMFLTVLVVSIIGIFNLYTQADLIAIYFILAAMGLVWFIILILRSS